MRGIAAAVVILTTIGGGTALAGRNNLLSCGGWHSSYGDYVEARRALATGHAISTAAAATKRLEAEGFSSIAGLFQDGAGVWHAEGIKEGTRQAIALNPNGNMAVGYRNIYRECGN
jgi:hypothetical protein